MDSEWVAASEGAGSILPKDPVAPLTKAPDDAVPSTAILPNLVLRLAGHSVVVVGDAFLDEYLVGRSERLSREAPIPVLAFERRFCLPGGAANPARNVARLGSRPVQVTVVGDDDAGHQLRAALLEHGISDAGVVIDPDRATTVKTRILAEGAAQPQQMARIDRQDRAPVAGAVEEKVCEAIRELAGDASAVLVSDYKSGVITHPVLETIRGVSIPGRLTSVDSQGDLHRFAGFRVVRGHARDVERAVGYQLVGEDDFQMAAEHLLRALSAELVVISRSRDGMSLATRDGGYFHVPAANLTEVYDVTGAGDTSIAVLSLALLAGASAVQAAWLASCAAGLTVRRIGVAAPSMDELLEAAKALPPAVQGAG